MEAYVGIDGGSTGTRGAATDRDGNLIFSATAPRLLHLMSPGGPKRLRGSLNEIKNCLPADVSVPVVFMALTGVERPGDTAQKIALDVARDVWPGSRLVADTDGMAAWAGATGCRAGVAAMGGTGCVVIAVNENGERVRTGGWGPTLGDAGGGWGIGISAVRQMLRRLDAGEAPSKLDRLLLSALELTGPEDVSGPVTSGRIARVRISELARVVASVADRDASARKILGDAGTALAVDAVNAIHRLNWSSTPVKVIPMGNAFNAGAAYLGRFQLAVTRRCRVAVQFDEPRLSNLGGTLLLALKEAGFTPDARLERLASFDSLHWRDHS